jgi:hypothetical protein
VDDHGKPDLAGQTDLASKDLSLHVSRRVVVVEVEADLPEGHDAAFLGQAAELVVDRVGCELGLVRVDAGRSREAVGLGHAKRAQVAVFLVHSPDDQHLLDTRLASSGHDLVAVGIELGHVDVAVAVGECDGRLSHDCHSSSTLKADQIDDLVRGPCRYSMRNSSVRFSARSKVTVPPHPALRFRRPRT